MRALERFVQHNFIFLKPGTSAETLTRFTDAINVVNKEKVPLSESSYPHDVRQFYIDAFLQIVLPDGVMKEKNIAFPAPEGSMHIADGDMLGEIRFPPGMEPY